MPKFIFLDTNNWIYLSNGFNILSNKHDELHLKIFETIEKRVEEGSIAFLINDIVINEWYRNIDKAEEQIKAIKKKHKAYLDNLKTIKTFIGKTLPEIDKIKSILNEKFDEKIQRHQNHIKSVENFLLNKTIKIEISDTCKIEASNLALAKKAPFIGDKKNSMADALILLSSIEYINLHEKIEHSQYNGFAKLKQRQTYFPESFFVSSNKGDFSSPDNKEIIHEDLEPYLQRTETKFFFTLGKLINSLEERFLTEEEQNIIEHFDDSEYCEICGFEYYPTIDYSDYFEIYDPDKNFIDRNQLTLDFPEQTLVKNITESMMSPMTSIRTAKCSHCSTEFFECDCGELMQIDTYDSEFECTGNCGRIYIVHADIDRKGMIHGIEIEIVKKYYCKNCGDYFDSVNEFGFCETCVEYENKSIND